MIVEGLPATETEEMSTYRLLRLQKPRNVQEAIRYCKSLLEHFPGCDAKRCKHMGKKGPSWVLQRLSHDGLEKLRMHEIRRVLTTSTNLFSLVFT